MFNDSNLKKFTIFDISTKMQTQKDSIEFAIELSLIRILNFCKKCKIAAKNIQEKIQFMIRCSICFKKWSLLKKTIFFNSKITIKSILRLIYCFTMKMPNKLAISQTGLSNRSVVNGTEFLKKFVFQLIIKLKMRKLEEVRQ